MLSTKEIEAIQLLEATENSVFMLKASGRMSHDTIQARKRSIEKQLKESGINNPVVIHEPDIEVETAFKTQYRKTGGLV